MSTQNLMKVTYYDQDRSIRLTGYADTVVWDEQPRPLLAALRFGGYPEAVRGLSDAIYGGATVDGRLQTRPWTDREGNKRTAYEIVTDNVYFGDSKPKGVGEEAGEDDYGQYQSNGYGGYTGPDAGAVPGGFAPDF